MGDLSSTRSIQKKYQLICLWTHSPPYFTEGVTGRLSRIGWLLQCSNYVSTPPPRSQKKRQRCAKKSLQTTQKRGQKSHALGTPLLPPTQRRNLTVFLTFDLCLVSPNACIGKYASIAQWHKNSTFGIQMAICCLPYCLDPNNTRQKRSERYGLVAMCLEADTIDPRGAPKQWLRKKHIPRAHKPCSWSMRIYEVCLVLDALQVKHINSRCLYGVVHGPRLNNMTPCFNPRTLGSISTVNFS